MKYSNLKQKSNDRPNVVNTEFHLEKSSREEGGQVTIPDKWKKLTSIQAQRLGRGWKLCGINFPRLCLMMFFKQSCPVGKTQLWEDTVVGTWPVILGGLCLG